jgi:hypothetical protein
MENIEIALDVAKSYYAETGKPVPTSVTEYILNYPPGLSRQVLSSRYGLKCSDFVKLLDPTYVKPLSAAERVIEESRRLNFTLLSDLSELKRNRDKVIIQYNECGHVHEATIMSICGTKLGCRKCKSGNLAWKDREEELKQIILDTFEAELISPIPDKVYIMKTI